ncbi:hypothetical protein PoB_003737900 [Plakobranchus ocellatus]|uniref:Uncharacterized protein n=1 Tax=Plakobranchus ocellatus TaxID=259542 RepID=A0AAV4AXK9_9GAST|nr:hypothetical protein PoB_003737900 [Plakobranchus ocellatus]
MKSCPGAAPRGGVGRRKRGLGTATAKCELNKFQSGPYLDNVKREVPKAAVSYTVREAGSVATTIAPVMQLRSVCPQQGDLRLSGRPSAEAPVTGLEPATEGSLQMSVRMRFPLCDQHPPESAGTCWSAA